MRILRPNLKVLWLLALVSVTPHARAEVLLRPALTYTIDKSGTSNLVTTTRQLVDLAGGYLTADGWAILAMYSMESTKVETSTGSTNTDRSSYGAGGGWYSKQAMGPYVDAIYYINSTQTSPNSKYEGSGWQVDVGYKFTVSGSFGIGFQLAYRSFNYPKLNGASLPTPYQKTNLDPMIAVVAAF